MGRFEEIEAVAMAVFGAPISSYERNIVARVYDELEHLRSSQTEESADVIDD
jgi:hypothetical protein